MPKQVSVQYNFQVLDSDNTPETYTGMLDLRSVFKIDGGSVPSTWEVFIAQSQMEFIITPSDISPALNILNVGKRYTLNWAGQDTLTFNLLIRIPATVNTQDTSQLLYRFSINSKTPIVFVEEEGTGYKIAVMPFSIAPDEVNSAVIEVSNSNIQSSGNDSLVYRPIDPLRVFTTTLRRTDTAAITGSMTGFTTGSQEVNDRLYNIQVYSSTETGAKKAFVLTYGNIAGSGSILQDNSITSNVTVPRAIYKQLSMYLEQSGSLNYGIDGELDEIKSAYFLALNRINRQDGFDVDSWEITLSELTGDGFSSDAYTGSNIAVSGSGEKRSLIPMLSGSSFITSGRKEDNRSHSYPLVSGSITEGMYLTGGSPVKYGRVYVTSGIAILDGDMLDSELSFNTYTGSSIHGQNTERLFTSLSKVIFRSYKKLDKKTYILPIEPAHFNFSNNPTYVEDYKSRQTTSETPYTASAMQLRNKDWFISTGGQTIVAPRAYVTSIGLYDNDYNLLAVGKLSKAQLKTPEDIMLAHVNVEA